MSPYSRPILSSKPNLDAELGLGIGAITIGLALSIFSGDKEVVRKPEPTEAQSISKEAQSDWDQLSAPRYHPVDTPITE